LALHVLVTDIRRARVFTKSWQNTVLQMSRDIGLEGFPVLACCFMYFDLLLFPEYVVLFYVV